MDLPSHGPSSSFQVDDAQDCSGAQADEGIVQCVPGKVLVCSKDKATLQYTMQHPSELYAACDCETGRQKSICHHQVAYLLFCTETDIALWEALSWLIPNPAASSRRIAPAARTEAPNPMAAAAKPNAVGGTAEVSDKGDSPTSQVAATPTIFGKVARDIWRTRSLQRLHRIFEDMESAPSEVRGDLAVHIDSLLSAAGAASSGAATQRTCYTGADFQKPERNSFKRKRGP
jgi:hypothetical protein